MAKAARPGTRPGAQPGDNDMTVVVDGVRYPIALDAVTARDSSALRRATGMSLRSLMAAAGEDPDIDVIAALVWLSRRQQGEDVTYDDVADAIGYQSDFDYEAKAEEDPDSPEA